MSTPMPMETPKNDESLADPELRKFLLEFVKRRVSASDADDIVQTVLCEALVAKNLPSDKEELRKYLLGITRHKVVDTHRRTSREEIGDIPEQVANPPPVEEEALLRWAEKQAPPTEEAQKTLSWMAREGEGEKLESIAADERVPAARVRQRVSRMRRWMKERWMAELAAVAALGALIFVVWRILRQTPDDHEMVKPDVTAEPVDNSLLEKARLLRAEALRLCDEGKYPQCVAGLDEAKKLDPAGDTARDVQWAREKARLSIEPKPAPTSSETLENAPAPKTTEVPQKTKPAPTVTPKPKPIPKRNPKVEPEAPNLDDEDVFQKKGGFQKK